MTYQEKAKELVGKIFAAQHIDDSAKLIGISSKKIALICVDEILTAEPTEPRNSTFYENVSDLTDEAKEFWQQVKEAISNL